MAYVISRWILREMPNVFQKLFFRINLQSSVSNICVSQVGKQKKISRDFWAAYIKRKSPIPFGTQIEQRNNTT